LNKEKASERRTSARLFSRSPNDFFKTDMAASEYQSGVSECTSATRHHQLTTVWRRLRNPIEQLILLALCNK